MVHSFQVKGFTFTIDNEDKDLLDICPWYLSRSYLKSSKLKCGMHNLILERKMGRKLNDKEKPDHIDRNPFNNTRNNLRPANKQQNAINTSKRKQESCTSIYKGVSYDSRRKAYGCVITVEQKSRALGYYKTEIEAGAIYNYAAVELFGEYACLNPIEEWEVIVKSLLHTLNGLQKVICNNNTSGFRGVGWATTKNKWRATIKVSSKTIHLGYFDNQIDAAKCYNEAALKYHGEKAKLNIIPE